MFSDNSNALQINIYSDEFSALTLLNLVISTKVNGFYFTLGNFPLKERSGLKANNLLCYQRGTISDLL